MFKEYLFKYIAKKLNKFFVEPYCLTILAQN